MAWLCEAVGLAQWLLRVEDASLCSGVARAGNTLLRQRIKEEFMRSRQTYRSPRLPQTLGCPGRRNRVARLMHLERLFARRLLPGELAAARGEGDPLRLAIDLKNTFP